MRTETALTEWIESGGTLYPWLVATDDGQVLGYASASASITEAGIYQFVGSGGYAERVREIARRAKVSVGSVFTGFASKAEVLSQVMQERREGLYEELDRVGELGREVVGALLDEGADHHVRNSAADD